MESLLVLRRLYVHVFDRSRRRAAPRSDEIEILEGGSYRDGTSRPERCAEWPLT